MNRAIYILVTAALLVSTTNFTIHKALAYFTTEEEVIVEPIATPTPMPTPIPTVTPMPNRTIMAIDAHLQGGLLENYGAIYVAAGQKYNVDSKILAAMSIHETQVDGVPGVSKVLREANNVGGINWTAHMYIRDGNKLKKVPTIFAKYSWYNKYDSIEQSIYDMANRLRMFYYDEGKTTLITIGAKWAPLNDPRNGIKGMSNASWVPSTSKIYKSIKEMAL